jgi:hypothetical protein
MKCLDPPLVTCKLSIETYVSRRGVQNQNNPIENCKSNQSKSKPQKTAFDSDVFVSIVYTNAWFSSVCGYNFTNQTKPNRNIRITLIKYISLGPILIETQCKL